ncbi:Pentatricopeptide repeat [Macleaya cordata]|uniref:Pentatricopeptide repeat n=1 Tax=Macleaya cordata TaxID=56857 RepID=A0A200Q0B6_MACCD|nr:Pentatricopeptide repeat [Macleaya cordata]
MMIWNTLLREYSLGLFPEEALNLYKLVFHECSPSSVPSDSFTFSFLLKACANLNQPIKGTQVHAHIIKFGFEFHVYVQTALVNMYLICGCLGDGVKVFEVMPERNLVTWNVMITGLTKLGELNIARPYFDEMPHRTVISWTGIIDGHTRLNQHAEALTLFRRMTMSEGIKPTEITILAILPAVWNLGSLDLSHSLYAYSEKTGFISSDIRVTNSFIDTFAKCGCIDSSFRVFEEISRERKNLITWTSIISGLAMHGMAKEAVKYFEEMEKEGFKPNRITFLSVLSACSHGGLIEEGVGFFEKMVYGYQIMPDIKHYGCMIDMLGRVGMLEEAEKMAMEVPVEMANVVIWRTLLGACSFHGNVEMSERVMKKILEIERGYGGDYVLFSNILSGVGRFGDAERVRRLMDERKVLKIPGLSLVDQEISRI